MKRPLLIFAACLCLSALVVASDYTGPSTPANEDTVETLLKKIAKSVSSTTSSNGTATGTATTTVPKQYTTTPSNYTVATADTTVFTLAAGERGFIQNLDDAALAVKYGTGASSSSFSFVYGPGAASDDGKGGYRFITDWVGPVSVAAMTGTARYIAWKQAP